MFLMFNDVFVRVERWGLDFVQPLTVTEGAASQGAFSFAALEKSVFREIG